MVVNGKQAWDPLEQEPIQKLHINYNNNSYSLFKNVVYNFVEKVENKILSNIVKDPVPQTLSVNHVGYQE